MSATHSLAAVVLAGGTADEEFQKVSGVTIRALAPFRHSTMLQHVTSAITQTTFPMSVNDLVVVADLPQGSGYRTISDTGTFTGNLCAGLQEVSSYDLALVSTADIPFITPETITMFLSEAAKYMEDQDTALVWPVVPVNLCYTNYPGIKLTAIKLREGFLTGGNVGLVRPQKLLSCLPAINRAFDARKSPLKLAGILGPSVIARLLISQLAVPSILTTTFLENAVSKLIGGKARAVVCHLPEIATDIDRASDYLAVTSSL